MDWITEIKNHRWKKWSQTGEEGYINYIASNIKNFSDTLVDIGAGLNLSNTRWFMEHNWWGLRFDGEPTDKDIIKAWITKNNICELLKEHNCPTEFGLLSIDVDGNDYHILDELLKEYHPMIICSEFNGIFPIEQSVTIKYNADHVWNNDDYYAYSLGAGLKLADKHGYRIVFQNDSQNIYYVRKDCLKNPDVEINLNFVPINYHAHNTTGEWQTI